MVQRLTRWLARSLITAACLLATAILTRSADSAPELRFSHERGFYDKPFVLVLWSGETNAVIRYTLDGASPDLINSAEYRQPLQVGGTSVIRASLFANGEAISKPVTHTFIFVGDVVRQSPGGWAPPGWGTGWGWGGADSDFGMDPSVVNDPAYAGTIQDDLKSVPSFSIVMRLGDLFDSSTGIYANASQDGRDWERPASVELIYPDGKEGFQIDAGIRIRGGYSRSGENPKHGFRLFFRKEYGKGKLKYPLFGEQGASNFDSVDLRTFQNYSWSFGGDSRGVFIRDQFCRDTQLDLGRPGERGGYYHLYINGQYWGLYNTCERPEASYGETYFGGYKQDYDTIKVDNKPYKIIATDGNMDAWSRLYKEAQAGFSDNESYLRIQGLAPNAEGKLENLLDVDNLIDYMLVILYGGNKDAPISWFLGNARPNNWYGLRNRSGADGFRFFIHDAEHTLLDVNEDRSGPYPAGDSSIDYSNPQWLWQKLAVNSEFRLKVADHVQRAFFNGGPLTPEACIARFQKRTNEIYRAVTAESARWGDSKRNPALTRDTDWLEAVNNILTNYFPKRSAIVLAQLRKSGLYSPVSAPVFNVASGSVSDGYPLYMSASNGVICYTMDGSDPRVFGGGLASGAMIYRSAIPVTSNMTVNARALRGTAWSALNTVILQVARTFTNLYVTEIMYDPPSDGVLEGGQFEFVELHNASGEEMDLSGVSFTRGIHYSFASGETLGAGKYVVLAKNPVALSFLYPDIDIKGPYEGTLSQTGETLELAHASGSFIFSFQYRNNPPWPQSPAGNGFSLVVQDAEETGDPNSPGHWRASSKAGGSPGRADPPYHGGIVLINEAASRRSPGFLELYNPTMQPVDIGGWYLTDDPHMPRKFRLASPAVIPSGAYSVLSETNGFGGGTNNFRLSPAGGQIYIYAAGSNGELTGFGEGFSYGASAEGASFGRHTNSIGRVQLVPTATASPGRLNSTPLAGPVVIHKIHYRPRPGEDAFVEVKNITDTRVALFDFGQPALTWKLDGLKFSFPAGTWLAPGETAQIVSTDPEVFKNITKLPRSAQVFGPFQGVLKPEHLRLIRIESFSPAPGQPPEPVEIVVDEVDFKDKPPWPGGVSGSWPALERTAPAQFGDDPASWQLGEGAPTPYKTLESSLETEDFLQWERHYFSDAEMRDSRVSGALVDSDADGMTNAEEYLAQTDPRNPASVLRLNTAINGRQIRFSFQAFEGKAYEIQRAEDMSKGPWTVLKTVSGEPGGGVIEFSEPVDGIARFYRLQLRP